MSGEQATEATGHVIAVVLAKSVVDALVLDGLLAPSPTAPREMAGAVEGATFRLRWARPSLTFPPDAPEQVRLGLAIEGGVALPSGHILSADAFVTVTASPEPQRDAAGWRAVLPLRAPDAGDVRLTYLGERLHDGPGLADGLPTTAQQAIIKHHLREQIVAFVTAMPPLPLSFSLPVPPTTPAFLHVIAEGQDAAALALCLGEDRAALPTVTPMLNVALTLGAERFATAFDAHAASLPPAIAAAGIVGLRATLAPRSGVVFAAQVVVGDAAPVAYTIRARPLLLGGPWDILIDAVQPPADLAADDPARAFAERPLSDEPLRLALAAMIQRAAGAALAEVLGGDGDAAEWSWKLPDAGDTQEQARFVPTMAHMSRGMLVLAGRVPTEPRHAEPPVDVASFDLRLAGEPTTTDDGLRATIEAFGLRGAEVPVEYAWTTSLSPEASLAHGTSLTLTLPRHPPHPPDPPRRTRSRPLLPGVVLVSAAVVDQFGRMSRAEMELEQTPQALLKSISTAAHPVPTGALSSPAEYLPAAARSGFYTVTHTLEEVTRALPTRSPTWRYLAATLSVLALIITFATVLALRGEREELPTTTPLGKSSPTATIAATATPALQQTPIVATPPIVPSATPTAVIYGRFDIAPTTMLFACGGTTRAPLVMTVTNTGTASMSWSAHAVEAIGGVAWTALAPSHGTLAPRATTTVTATPVAAFCATPLSAHYRIQFTAPNVVPVTVTATHT